MPRLEILPDGEAIEALEQETILQALLRHGIAHAHVCGGNARCSTCRFLVLEGLEFCSPRSPKEQRIADRLHFPPAIRLACQTHTSGPMKIRRLIIDDEDIEVNSLRLDRQPRGGGGGGKKSIHSFCRYSGVYRFC